MLRRSLTTALVFVCLATLAPTNSSAGIKAWRWEKCRFQSLENGHWTIREVHLTIHCGVRHFPVSHGTADYIADRESGMRWNAQNPYSSACGVYQFVSGTWAGVQDQMQRWWHRWGLSHECTNARANVLAAIRYASRHGWGPWGY